MSTLSGRQTMHPSQKKSSTRRAGDTGPMTSLADIDSERTRVRAMLQEIIEGPTAILQSAGGDHVTKSSAMTIPVGYVPTPTREYRQHRKLLRAATGIVSRPSIRIIPDREIGRIPVPAPIPFPRIKGSRVLMWKQDPSVSEIGIRKAYLSGLVLAGPRDGRITIQGPPVVSPNAMADFIETPGTQEFDAVHTFAVVRQMLTLAQRARGGAVAPWQWNSPSNTDPVTVFPRAGVTPNTFYSPNLKALKFFFFTKPGSPPGSPQVFTCRSFDIVAHETGHAILDGMKPGWLDASNHPQTGGLHESFGDLCAIFLTLSQFDQVEAIIAQTKANLHDKTFLADMAEEFGLALGRPNGLRNADNDLKLSEVTNEVHDLSQVFTGGIYDVLADIFAFERKPAMRDDARVLLEAGEYLFGLILRAVAAAPAANATFADIANQMLTIAHADGKPVQYRNSIRNRFTLREVVVSPTPLTADHKAGVKLAPVFTEEAGMAQDRRGCCGTMQLPEFNGGDALLEDELDELRNSFNGNGKGKQIHR